MEKMIHSTMTISLILVLSIGISEAFQRTADIIEEHPNALQKAVEMQDLMKELGIGQCSLMQATELGQIGMECRQKASSKTITGKNQICPLLEDYFNCFDRFNECFTTENVNKIKVAVYKIWETQLIPAAREFVKNCPEYSKLMQE